MKFIRNHILKPKKSCFRRKSSGVSGRHKGQGLIFDQMTACHHLRHNCQLRWTKRVTNFEKLKTNNNKTEEETTTKQENGLPKLLNGWEDQKLNTYAHTKTYLVCRTTTSTLRWSLHLCNCACARTLFWTLLMWRP